MRARPIVRALAVIAALSGAVWFRARRPGAKAAGTATNALVAARPYRLVAPSILDPRKTYPLVLVLHGWGGTSEHIERYYQLDHLVDERAFFVALSRGDRGYTPETLLGRPPPILERDPRLLRFLRRGRRRRRLPRRRHRRRDRPLPRRSQPRFRNWPLERRMSRPLCLLPC